jgi:hypothetical protein
MSVNVNEIIRKLSPAERKKVEDRAANIIAEEMSLRDLRKARKLTQARVAETLGITLRPLPRMHPSHSPTTFWNYDLSHETSFATPILYFSRRLHSVSASPRTPGLFLEQTGLPAGWRWISR